MSAPQARNCGDSEEGDSCCADALCESSGQYERPLYLLAAMFAAQTPLAEVLAVIAEEPIAVLADPGPRSPNHFLAAEASGAGSDPEGVPMSETRERNLFDRTPVEPMCERAVMDNPAAVDVDTVVGKTQPGCQEVRAQRRFLTFGEASIALMKSAVKETPVCRDRSITVLAVLLRRGTREAGNQGLARHLHSLLDRIRA
jgi:hypothetical protein